MTKNLCFLRSIWMRLVAFSLVLSMLIPTIVVGDLGTRRAKAANIPLAPPAAPPQSYVLGGEATNTSRYTLLTLSLVASVFGLLPAGSANSAVENEEKNPVDESKVITADDSAFLREGEEMEPSLQPLTAVSAVKFDFDDDGKADISRTRVVTNSGGSVNEYRFRRSSNGAFDEFSLGTGSGRIAPADFNGDGQTDAAVFEAGTWKYKTSTGGSEQTISFGAAGDIPVAADYDKDGITDAAVFRPSNYTWYVKQSTTSNMVQMTWGQSGDIPALGDYDGDGKSDYAIWRPSTGVWYVVGSTAGQFAIHWGVGATDIPVPADYDGDGQTDMGVFRRTTGMWYIKTSSSGYISWVTQSWGNYGDQPVPADYDGDGKDDYAVWRVKTGVWWIIYSSNLNIDAVELGVQGDTAVPSAYLQQVGGSVPVDELAAERLKPRNATGGTDLYSQNFSWGRNLVSLPGRAGLDLSLGIGYNSLVWTKAGSEMYFDLDTSNVSPGFRLGFPTIEPIYFDEAKGKYAYMMVTPSGGRVQFRETAVSNIFETADSSYTALEVAGASNPNSPVENITITVRPTDGSRLKYEWKDGAFRCTEIKDRNGNYITIAYDANGRLQSVTDTLGRVVNVGHDASGYPISITQAWQSGTHPYASFSYTDVTINTNFSSPLTVVGPLNTTVVRALERITYPDGSYTKFTYNSYGQVWKVQNYAPNNNELNHVRTNLETPASPESDCPRLGKTWSYVQNFNNGNPVEVTNTLTPGQSFSVGGLTGTGAKIEVTMTDQPDGLYSRTYVAESGWKEGMTLATEDCIGTNCAQQKRWTWTNYTQDNTALTYTLNPRVIETRIGDGVNTKKTTVEYHMLTGAPTVAEYGLVKKLELGDLSTVLKRVETDFNLAQVYKDKRIIGLPSETRAWGKNDQTQSLEQVSRVIYGYDEENFQQESNQIISSVYHHDTTNYGSGLIAGRGNLTSTTRHDITGQTAAVTARTRYDIAGSTVAQVDPLNRKVRISYADDFLPAQTFSTYAYPTAITDSLGTSVADPLHSTKIKYRYDFGANVRAESPAPQGQSQGKISEREFDSIGRLSKEKVLNHGGAYTRYEYPTNGVQSKVYTTIVDTNSNSVGDAVDEVLSESWFDGLRRVRKSRTAHPSSVGGWSATIVEYDILGRVNRTLVPTEISVPDENNPDTWALAGDDISRGWLWKYQKYDWMNRVVRKINTDGTDQPTYNDSDILITYEGCGCSGGTIATIQGEKIVETDWQGSNPTTLGRRIKKVYSDLFGREWKTEILNWNGSVYSTSLTQFNGRDQAISITQTEQSTSESQMTTMTYDGHGRLKTHHLPDQKSNTATAYDYYSDDRLLSSTDARGVVAAFEYEDRGLVEQISYSIPNPLPPNEPNISQSAPVSFTYDAVGNRISMTDGFGTLSYEYDELSRLTAETRAFSGPNVSSMPSAPLPNNTFKITYDYHLTGAVKSITDAYGAGVSYQPDKIGRVNAILGNGFAGIGTYVANTKYRAWGALKEIQAANTIKTSFTYNNRLLVETQIINGDAPFGVPTSKHYKYTADGNIRFSDDLSFFNDSDAAYRFDHAGRMIAANSGTWARGEPELPPINKTLYKYSFIYNAWGDVISENKAVEFSQGQGNVPSRTYTYSNNRLINTTYNSVTTLNNSFDAEGRLTRESEFGYFRDNKYAADGSLASVTQPNNYEQHRFTNGDGHVVKERFAAYNPTTQTYDEQNQTYYIRSTVFSGDTLTEVNKNGGKERTFVYGFGRVIAYQAFGYQGSPPYVNWEYQDLLKSRHQINSPGFEALGNNLELDPFGAIVRDNTAEEDPPDPYWLYPRMDQAEGDGGCWVDGIETLCSNAVRIINNGVGVQCPNNNCGPVYNPRDINGDGTIDSYWDRFHASADGFSGYGPATGAVYAGDGRFRLPNSGGRGEPPQLSIPREDRQPTPVGGGSDPEGDDMLWQPETWQSQIAVTPGSQNYVSRDDANKMMVDAYNGALDLMKNNKNCRDAVSTTAVDAVEQAERISREGRFIPRENEINGTTIADSMRVNINASAWTVKIHIDGGDVRFFNSFFQPNINSRFDVGNHTPKDLGMNSDQARVLIVLHELAHVTGKYVHPRASFVARWARRNEEEIESYEMNALIWYACFAKK